MQLTRRHFCNTALAAALVRSTPAFAQTVGKEYTPISPAQPVEEAGKIEVVEFFSYGCPHCHEFHPFVAAWSARLPGDVAFRRIPVTFGRAAWANIARLYYALEVTNDLGKLDDSIFKAIHNEKINLFDTKELTQWLAGKSVNMKKFDEAFNSFGVASKVKRGDQMAGAFKINGVPSIAVQGKYMVADMDFKEKLRVTDQLIAKVRSENPGKK